MSDDLRLPGLDPSPLSSVEELVNTLTHGFGLALSIVGAVVLAACVLSDGDAWRLVGCGVYAASLISVYATSTLSHSITLPDRRRFFRILDQGCIYLLIVATYTPFALAFLRTGGWWLFLALLWSVALFGFFSKILFAHRVEKVSIWLYLVLGWLPVVSASSLLETVPAIALWWMLIGGLCYTLGTVFLIYDKHVFHFHAVWHLLVIVGSAWHFFAILLFVAPVGHA